MKGQLNMVMLVVAILAFFGIMIFIAGIAPREEGDREYLGMLSGNLLLTILRSDTGIGDSECATVAGLVACAVTKPEYVCSGMKVGCREIAEASVNGIIKRYPYLDKYDVLFSTDSRGLAGPSGELSIGAASLAEPGRERFASDRIIQIVTDGSPITVEVRLFLGRRS